MELLPELEDDDDEEEAGGGEELLLLEALDRLELLEPLDLELPPEPALLLEEEDDDEGETLLPLEP